MISDVSGLGARLRVIPDTQRLRALHKVYPMQFLICAQVRKQVYTFRFLVCSDFILGRDLYIYVYVCAHVCVCVCVCVCTHTYAHTPHA